MTNLSKPVEIHHSGDANTIFGTVTSNSVYSLLLGEGAGDRKTGIVLQNQSAGGEIIEVRVGDDSGSGFVLFDYTALGKISTHKVWGQGAIYFKLQTGTGTGILVGQPE